MLKNAESARSPSPTLDPTTHAECLEFIRAAIASADRQTAHNIAGVVKDCCENGYADRTIIWNDLTPSEQTEYRTLLAPPPIVQNFAKRILESIGWQSPGVAAGIDCDLERAIDAGELLLADLVGVVGDRQFLDFKELVARCPRRHQKN